MGDLGATAALDQARKESRAVQFALADVWNRRAHSDAVVVYGFPHLHFPLSVPDCLLWMCCASAHHCSAYAGWLHNMHFNSASVRGPKYTAKLSKDQNSVVYGLKYSCISLPRNKASETTEISKIRIASTHHLKEIQGGIKFYGLTPPLPSETKR
jgi:hypothetical protein